jgi:hypothetical protein
VHCNNSYNRDNFYKQEVVCPGKFSRPTSQQNCENIETELFLKDSLNALWTIMIY